MFDNKSTVKTLSGTFSDKVMQLKSGSVAWGSTNFQSVIDEIIRIRLDFPSIPIEDFPSTLLVVSDMQFNPVNGNSQTNYDRAMRRLAAVGLPKVRIVWWWVTGRASDFPSTLDDENVIMIGGFDGAILSMLLKEDPKEDYLKSLGSNTRKGPIQAMQKALNQDVLELIQV